MSSPIGRRSRSSSSSSSSSTRIPLFSDLAPTRAPTTTADEEQLIPVPNLNYPTASPGVRLKVDAGPGCGGIAWPAGEVLARYVAWKWESSGGKGQLGNESRSREADEDEDEDEGDRAVDEITTANLETETDEGENWLTGKRVLELGSGTGLVGLAVGMLERTARVEVTDQAVLLDLMKQNIQLNYSSAAEAHLRGDSQSQSISKTHRSPATPIPNVVASELNWGDPLPSHIKPESLDMVLAADCVYFEPAFPLLVQTLCDLSPPPPSRPVPIYFCWKKRRKADKRFFAMLKKHFDSRPVEDDRPGERERYEREGVTLLILTRRK